MEKTIDAHCVTAVVAAETPPPSSLITLGDTLPCPEGHGGRDGSIVQRPTKDLRSFVVCTTISQLQVSQPPCVPFRADHRRNQANYPQ